MSKLGIPYNVLRLPDGVPEHVDAYLRMLEGRTGGHTGSAIKHGADPSVYLPIRGSEF